MFKYSGCMLLLGGVGCWPLIMSPKGILEMHWAVAYILCVISTGILEPLFVSVAIATILDAFEQLELVDAAWHLLLVQVASCASG